MSHVEWGGVRMKRFPMGGIVMAALMVTAPLFAWILTPQKSIAETVRSVDLERAIPLQFGDWRVDRAALSLVPAADKEQLIAAIYSQIVNRTYVNGRGERMMVSIAYGSEQSKQLRAHRQEVCYAAQGFKIEKLQKADLNIAGTNVMATQMVAVQGQRVEPVTYWFTMGDRIVRGYLERELVQLRYAASGYLPDGYLVRVSSISRDAEQAFVSQSAFASALIAATEPQLSARLVGRAASTH